jgi:hypothetical protein
MLLLNEAIDFNLLLGHNRNLSGKGALIYGGTFRIHDFYCSIITFLDTIRRLVFRPKCRPGYFQNNVSETGFYLRPQGKSTHLGPIDRASPISGYLCHFQDGVCKSKQHNSSVRAKL